MNAVSFVSRCLQETCRSKAIRVGWCIYLYFWPIILNLLRLKPQLSFYDEFVHYKLLSISFQNIFFSVDALYELHLHLKVLCELEECKTKSAPSYFLLRNITVVYFCAISTEYHKSYAVHYTVSMISFLKFCLIFNCLINLFSFKIQDQNSEVWS